MMRASELKRAPISRAEYLSSVPIPTSELEKKPLFMPFFRPKSSTVSSFPSLMPVTLARSLFSSYALTLSTIDVGRFFMAVCVSPVMNSFPSTRIFFTSLPLMVIFPLSSTCAPGSRFTSSSMVEPSGVRYAALLYIKVSSLIVTFRACAVTCVSLSRMASAVNCTVPMARSLSFSIMSFLTDVI